MTEHTDEVTDFRNWLRSYGTAWEGRDVTAFTALFTPDVTYHWTPFGTPNQGHDGVARAFTEATVTQRDIAFSASVLSVDGRIGIAHWNCQLTRIGTGRAFGIDGILFARFADDGRCQLFREWWHSSEHLEAAPRTAAMAPPAPVPHQALPGQSLPGQSLPGQPLRQASPAQPVGRVPASIGGTGPDEAAFLGTWRLESWMAEDRDGIETRPFGFEYDGLLTYSHGRRVSVQVMKQGRAPFANGRALGGTTAENDAAYKGFLAYAGTYEVEAGAGIVVHRIEVSSFPNWERSDLRRQFKLEGDMLELSTPPVEASDPTEGPLRHRLRWRRITSVE